MALGNTMKKVALRTAFDYIGKNPEENMPSSWIGWIGLRATARRASRFSGRR